MLFLLVLPLIPIQTSGIKFVIQLCGRARVDSGIGSTIGCGNSYLGEDCCVSNMSG
jgi:hypothetical protein